MAKAGLPAGAAGGARLEIETNRHIPITSSSIGAKVSVCLCYPQGYAAGPRTESWTGLRAFGLTHGTKAPQPSDDSSTVIAMLKAACLWNRPRLERYADGALGPRLTRSVRTTSSIVRIVSIASSTRSISRRLLKAAVASRQS